MFFVRRVGGGGVAEEGIPPSLRMIVSRYKRRGWMVVCIGKGNIGVVFVLWAGASPLFFFVRPWVWVVHAAVV